MRTLFRDGFLAGLARGTKAVAMRAMCRASQVTTVREALCAHSMPSGFLGILKTQGRIIILAYPSLVLVAAL